MSNKKKPEDYFREYGVERIKKQEDMIRQLMEIISGLETEINALKKKDLKSVIQVMGSLWNCGPMSSEFKSDFCIDDPIYGQICIPKEIAPVYFQPIVRRLSNIRQLSFAYIKFPTATHSRLSHSLGVARNAWHALQSIFSKERLYRRDRFVSISLSPVERRNLLLKTFAAGLLHDIGHGPFGHALDRFIAYGDPLNTRPKPDKHFTINYISKYLKDIAISGEVKYEDVGKILNPSTKLSLKGWDCLVAEILDSAIDTDRMDYLVRDAHLTGLTVGSVNMDALIERMIPFEEDGKIHLLYAESSIPYIENFMFARDVMFISCYEDPIKLAAEGMLLKAVRELIKDVNLEALLLLTDDQLLHILFHLAPSNLSSSKIIKQLISGDIFLKLMEFSASENRDKSGEIKSWWDAKMDDNWTKALIEKPLEWERSIASRSGIEEWQLLITVPSDEAFHDKQIYARILHEEDGAYNPRRLTEAAPVLDELGEILAKKRQMIRIFVSPELSREQCNMVRDKANEVILNM